MFVFVLGVLFSWSRNLASHAQNWNLLARWGAQIFSEHKEEQSLHINPNLQHVYVLYRACIRKRQSNFSVAIKLYLNYSAYELFFSYSERSNKLAVEWYVLNAKWIKKWANTDPIKNVSQNRLFSPLRVGSKTIEN